MSIYHLKDNHSKNTGQKGQGHKRPKGPRGPKEVIPEFFCLSAHCAPLFVARSARRRRSYGYA